MFAKPALLRQPTAWSAAAPLLCVAHCIATPVAVLFAPALVPGEWLESSLMLASGILAIAVGMTGVRLHGRLAVWIPLVAGIVVWIASLAGWAEPLPETATTIAGSLLLAAGMVWNARLRHQTVCGKCGCPAHSPE